MRHLVLSLAFAFAASLAGADTDNKDCDTGERTSVNEVMVDFSDCTDAPSDQTVRWFTTDGIHQGDFTITKGKSKKDVFPYEVEPLTVRMSTRSGRGCLRGKAKPASDGGCYAKYVFSCVARTYGLLVLPAQNVAYTVTRTISTPPDDPGKPCRHEYDVPPTSNVVFSDTETIAVTVAASVTNAGLKAFVGKYECNPQIGTQCKLQAKDEPTERHGAPAPNVEPLRRVKESLPGIKVTLEPRTK